VNDVVLALHILAAIAWSVLVQWPWGVWVFHALLALGVIHLIAPFWFHLARPQKQPFHRAFLFGPLVLAVLDGAFLLYAWRGEIWADLTVVIVPILSAASFALMLYGMLIMLLLDRWRTSRNERKNRPPE
jgi:hypothetical protein